MLFLSNICNTQENMLKIKYKNIHNKFTNTNYEKVNGEIYKSNSARKCVTFDNCLLHILEIGFSREKPVNSKNILGFKTETCDTIHLIILFKIKEFLNICVLVSFGNMRQRNICITLYYEI